MPTPTPRSLPEVMALDLDAFQNRHIGPQAKDVADMLAAVGSESLDALADEVVPSGIRLRDQLDLPPAQSEAEFLDTLRTTAAKNARFRSFIGLGYYGTITPSVILRNMLENPGWYSPYTPYQAEVAQGRLEALLVFQTMVEDLTGMEIANASLLDEATAAAEAMAMMHRIRARRPGRADCLLVSDSCWPQTIEVVRGRAEPLGIEVIVSPHDELAFDERAFGVLLQYPDAHGSIRPLDDVVARAHDAGAMVTVATDLLALTMLTPPGEAGADVVVGNSQRFGVPMGFGGPHAAFFATRSARVRQMPGRLIGVSSRRPWCGGVPHGPADPRAAHPAGACDLEHLHRAGTPGEHRRDVRRVPRPRGPARDWRTCPRNGAGAVTAP